MPQKPGARETAATTEAPSRPSAAAPTPAAGASTPAPPVASTEKLPAGDPPAAVAAEKEARPIDAPSGSVPDRKAATSGSSGAAATRVAEARLCGALSSGSGAWRCQPLTDERAGGAVYFYTRVASPTDAVVRHRWTRDGNVVRVVDLRIRANPKEGYRTYSRQTGRALEAGQWQVALLDPAGAVLQEESFVIK